MLILARVKIIITFETIMIRHRVTNKYIINIITIYSCVAYTYPGPAQGVGNIGPRLARQFSRGSEFSKQ